MKRMTIKELKAMLDESLKKIVDSARLKDANKLSEGILLMRQTKQMCLRHDREYLFKEYEHKFTFSVDVAECARSYRANKNNERYLDLLLSSISPRVPDIIDCVSPHTKDDVAAKLIKSFIQIALRRRSDSSVEWDIDRLLSHFAECQSDEAYCLLLDEQLLRLKEQDEGLRESQPIESSKFRLLSQLNNYTQHNTSRTTLPDIVIDTLAKHPFQLLAEHRKYSDVENFLTFSEGSSLDMHILKSLCYRHASNPAVMDVVIQIAGNSVYQMNDIRQVRWIEEIGVSINIDEVVNTFKFHHRDHHKIAALYYLLCSPSLTKEKFATVVAKYTTPLPIDLVEECLATAFNEFQTACENDQRLFSRVSLLTGRMIEIDQDNVRTLMKSTRFPTEKVMRDGRLRDKLMASDLGL